MKNKGDVSEGLYHKAFSKNHLKIQWELNKVAN